MSRKIGWIAFVAVFAAIAALGLYLQPAAAAVPLDAGHLVSGMSAIAFIGMTGINVRPSSRAALVGNLAPLSHTSARTTEYVDMAKFKSILALIEVGVMTDGGTCNAKLVQATDAAGTGSKDISGKAITALTTTMSPTVDANNREAEINCHEQELDIANSFRYVALTITTATQASVTAGQILGFDPVYGPASDNDLASVAQIV